MAKLRTPEDNRDFVTILSLLRSEVRNELDRGWERLDRKLIGEWEPDDWQKDEIYKAYEKTNGAYAEPPLFMVRAMAKLDALDRKRTAAKAERLHAHETAAAADDTVSPPPAREDTTEHKVTETPDRPAMKSLTQDQFQVVLTRLEDTSPKVCDQEWDRLNKLLNAGLRLAKSQRKRILTLGEQQQRIENRPHAPARRDPHPRDEVVEILKQQSLPAKGRGAAKAAAAAEPQTEACGEDAAAPTASAPPSPPGEQPAATIVRFPAAGTLAAWFWLPFSRYASWLCHLTRQHLAGPGLLGDHEVAMEVIWHSLNRVFFPHLNPKKGFGPGEFPRTLPWKTWAVIFLGRLYHYFDDLLLAAHYESDKAQYRCSPIGAKQWRPKERPDKKYHYFVRKLGSNVSRKVFAEIRDNSFFDFAVCQRFTRGAANSTLPLTVANIMGLTYVGTDFAMRWAGMDLFVGDKPIPLPPDFDADHAMLEVFFALQADMHGAQPVLPARLLRMVVRIDNRLQLYDEGWGTCTPTALVFQHPVNEEPTCDNVGQVFADGRALDMQFDSLTHRVFVALGLLTRRGNGVARLGALAEMVGRPLKTKEDLDSLCAMLTTIKSRYLCKALYWDRNTSECCLKIKDQDGEHPVEVIFADENGKEWSPRE